MIRRIESFLAHWGLATNRVVFGPRPEDGILLNPNNPVYAWRDLKGPVIPRFTGVGAPTFADWNAGSGGTIKRFWFAVGDSTDNTFHVDHDWVKGHIPYIHLHWTHIKSNVTEGGIAVSFVVTHSKGHNQEQFSDTVAITLEQDASLSSLQHMIGEVQLASSGGVGGLLDADLIEPDSVIEVKTVLTANTMDDSAVPFIHFVDIHYLSTGIGTVNRSPNFYS